MDSRDTLINKYNDIIDDFVNIIHSKCKTFNDKNMVHSLRSKISLVRREFSQEYIVEHTGKFLVQHEDKLKLTYASYFKNLANETSHVDVIIKLFDISESFNDIEKKTIITKINELVTIYKTIYNIPMKLIFPTKSKSQMS
jgi:hypothetical protein